MRKGGKVTIPKLDWGAPVSTEISLLLAPFDDTIIGEFSWISRSDLRRHRMTTWMLDSDDSDIFWDCVFRLEDWVELGLSLGLGSEGMGALMSGRGREAYIAGAVIPVVCLAAGLFEAIGSWNTGSSDCNSRRDVSRDYAWLHKSHASPKNSRPLSLWASAKSLPENRHWCARKHPLVSLLWWVYPVTYIWKETSFTCLFCHHEKSVTVRMDRKEGVANLVCRVCDQRYQSKVNRKCLLLFSTKPGPVTP